MPCAFGELTQEQTQSRERELRDLERRIEAGSVTVTVNGEDVQFLGWDTDRTGPGHWHDDCAYRTLLAEGSSALRMALARNQPDRMARRQTT